MQLKNVRTRTNDTDMTKTSKPKNLAANKARKKRLTALSNSTDLDTLQRSRLHKLAVSAASRMTLDELARFAGRSKGWWSWVVRAENVHAKEWRQVHPTLADLAAIESTVLVVNAGSRRAKSVIDKAKAVLMLSAQLRAASGELIAEAMK